MGIADSDGERRALSFDVAWQLACVVDAQGVVGCEPDCLEIAAERNVQRAFSAKQQHDISIVKRTRVVGHTNFEFHFEMLNAFNHANFTPVAGTTGTGTSTSPAPTSISAYQLTALSGTNTSRTIQLVFRFNW